MHDSHAELGQGPQQRHLFGGNLAGAQKGDRIGPVLALDSTEPVAKRLQRGLPWNGLQAARGITQ